MNRPERVSVFEDLKPRMLQTHAETQALRADFTAEVLGHIPALHRAALLLEQNRQDAEDLVQETLYRAFKFKDKFRPGSNCRAWLSRILKNQFINNYRSKLCRPRPKCIDEITDADLWQRAEENNFPKTPEQLLLDRSLDDGLWSAVQSLRAQYRSIVVLFILHGLSYRQIASIVDLKVGTVKSRLHRGRRLLRMELTERTETLSA